MCRSRVNTCETSGLYPSVVCKTYNKRKYLCLFNFESVLFGILAN